MSSNMKADEFDEETVTPLNSNQEGYKWGQPLYSGETTSCFTHGVLYRIIEKNNKNRWSFYNDTLDAKICVQFTFGPNSSIVALDNTTFETLGDGSFRATVNVYPMETELFIEGTVNGYSSNIHLQPLTEEYLSDVARQNEVVIKQESADLFKITGRNAPIEKLIDACIQNNLKFVDLFFPPEQTSLQVGSQTKMRLMPWERPRMYLSDANTSQCRLFRNGVHPKNIDEGDLGDSWVIGAIAALAEFPDKIRDIFRHPQSLERGKRERSLGIYRATLNKDGWWVNVVMDDYLPVVGGRPAFARSKGDPAEIWVSILQKAYAKLYGGYGFLTSGDPLHALQDITGFPCTPFDSVFINGNQFDSANLFDYLAQHCTNNYLIIFTTPTHRTIMNSRVGMQCAKIQQAESIYISANLLLGRCYAVYKMAYFPDIQLRMVQFRNVWAKSPPEHHIPWDKNDENWTKYPKVAEYFNISHQDDNMFCMEWSDVQKYFIGCGVCFLQSPMYDYRIRGCFVQNVPTCCLLVSVQRPTVMSIILTQDDKQGTNKVEHSPIMISIAHGNRDASVMNIDLNSSFDTDHPVREFTFVKSYSVSMFYEFIPERSPYLVIPRAISTYAQLPYVIGLISPYEIGGRSSYVNVSLRALAPDNRVFDNYQRFLCETLPAESEFQVKNIDQFFPDIYVGTSIMTSN
ncbi:unnamed protein product [Phytomonas sp. Hart1]|nr:unnamed protein product [Phytomonas sp. Hart1]|eukprot:CCW66394.1 unnamed protein product [Phytomonas sp. isolate Hart1]